MTKKKKKEKIENIEELMRKEKLNELEILKQSVEDAKKDAAENHDKFIRLNAEFINFKNRMEREKLDFLKYANNNILKALLPFIDSFENAIKTHDKDKDLKLLFDSLMDILKKEGFEKIEAIGKKFDHDLHDAVGFDKNNDFEENIVTCEMQAGYKLKDKVLRHSMVKVNKK